MAKKNRSTLKHFFRRGALPSENQFGDLIDSMLNMIDEGFDKSPEYGVEISPLGNRSSVVSFFRHNDPEHPVWTISLDEPSGRLLIQSRLGDHAPFRLSLSPDGRIGLNKKVPEWDLDVDGVVASRGRIGTSEGKLKVPADGQWHSITDELTGCQAFEVVAGAGGKEGDGNYALMHAFAVNAYNPSGPFFNFLNLKKRIRYQQAYYRSLGNKLKLRWIVKDRSRHTYQLQLRSNGDYGGTRDNKKYEIRYYITELWFDPTMAQSRPETSIPSDE
jgi:hypothetical protein